MSVVVVAKQEFRCRSEAREGFRPIFYVDRNQVVILPDVWIIGIKPKDRQILNSEGF